jgi:hypothetical protein
MIVDEAIKDSDPVKIGMIVTAISAMPVGVEICFSG